MLITIVLITIVLVLQLLCFKFFSHEREEIDLNECFLSTYHFLSALKEQEPYENKQLEADLKNFCFLDFVVSGSPETFYHLREPKYDVCFTEDFSQIHILENICPGKTREVSVEHWIQHVLNLIYILEVFDEDKLIQIENLV